MKRRAFLSLLATAAVGLAIDPDLANWKPKTYILPPAEGWKQIHEAQLEYNRLQSLHADGISIRFVRQYEVDSKEFPARFDILYGVQVLRPELACRISA